MNILRLDLIAFGPFDGRSLSFERPRPGLHLIFGHNEAGKSSCRRAVGQWLFGIPHKSADNFRHASNKLRVGGKLLSVHGETLEFLRKKGRKDTLRSFDDQATLSEDRLSPFLGSVDANTFHQRFSLDHQELVQGGQALAGGTELGDILFSAGAGIADIRNIQNRLQNRCRELFLPAGANPKINELLRELADTKAAQKSLLLSANVWADLENQLEQARANDAELSESVRELRRELRKLERQQQAIPLLLRFRRSQTMLESLANAPRLPQDFPNRRIQAMAHLSNAIRAKNDVALRITSLKEKLAGINVPEVLLQMKSVILALHTKLGSLQKASQDRVRLIAELRVTESQLEQCQQDWREFAHDSAAEVSLGVRLRSRLQELAEEFAAVSERQAMTSANVARMERELARIDEDGDLSDQRVDLDEWQVLLRPLLKNVELERQLGEANQKHEEMRARSHDLLHALPMRPQTVEELAAWSVPLPETVEKHAQQLVQLETAAGVTEAGIQRVRQQRRDVEHKLNVLQRTVQVPTEAELDAARQRRNQLWQAISARFVLQATDSDLEDAAELGLSTSTTGMELAATEFWNTTLAADALADRLRREASRVAQVAQWMADHELALEEERRLEEERDGNLRQLEEWRVQWKLMWSECGIEPLTPREMLSWLRKVSELREQWSAERQALATAERLSKEARRAKQTALKLAELFELPESVTSMSLEEIVKQCEKQIQSQRARQQQRDQARQRVLDLNSALEEHRQQLRATTAAQSSWQAHWSQLLSGAGLRQELMPRDVHVMIETFDRLQSLGKEATQFRQRIAGIDRDQQTFDTEVAALQRSLQVVSDLRSDQVISRLFEETAKAELDSGRKVEWEIRLAEEEEELTKQATAQRSWEHEIEELCQLANCQSVEELEQVERDGLQRAECERESTELQRQLRELAEDQAYETFVDEVAKLDFDEVSWQISQLKERLQESEAQRARQLEFIGRLRRELETLDGNSRAAQAQEDIVHHLAAIQHHAQQFISLKLAAGILGRVIDRYRQANQGGILERAGQLFAELTLGSFAKLHLEMEDNGCLQVLGVRADGETLVPTSGMSEGTCDQLYLAFRIALLEGFLEQHAPVPLLVDDLLITFDDRRSVAALRVLAELSRRTQVLFFTHHHRLIELAERELDRELFSVQSLDM
ncbi:MAG: AAA family ATPase [Planctomycetaceae bacterium]|nr:AAA family ATPase [Planctomycetaceae bacterium]